MKDSYKAKPTKPSNRLGNSKRSGSAVSSAVKKMAGNNAKTFKKKGM